MLFSWQYHLRIILLVALMLNAFNAKSYATNKADLFTYPMSSQVPLVMKGLRMDFAHPMKLEFTFEQGRQEVSSSQINQAIQYFLIALALPSKDIWVNLSPFESERIIPYPLDQTRMGQDLLMADNYLKFLAAQMIHPDTDSGKMFWKNVYARARAKYGDKAVVSLTTFHKVWIVADSAKVFENQNSGWVSDARLRVMMDSDYRAIKKWGKHREEDNIADEVYKQIILPLLEKEVNEGLSFTKVRQIFYAVILANWYKQHSRGLALNENWVNKKSLGGVKGNVKYSKEVIYQRYLKQVKQGAVQVIKEERDFSSNPITRKYFSGGIVVNEAMISPVSKMGPPVLPSKQSNYFKVTINLRANNAMAAVYKGMKKTRGPNKEFNKLIDIFGARFMQANPWWSYDLEELEQMTYNQLFDERRLSPTGLAHVRQVLEKHLKRMKYEQKPLDGIIKENTNVGALDLPEHFLYHQIKKGRLTINDLKKLSESSLNYELGLILTKDFKRKWHPTMLKIHFLVFKHSDLELKDLIDDFNLYEKRELNKQAILDLIREERSRVRIRSYDYNLNLLPESNDYLENFLKDDEDYEVHIIRYFPRNKLFRTTRTKDEILTEFILVPKSKVLPVEINESNKGGIDFDLRNAGLGQSDSTEEVRLNSKAWVSLEIEHKEISSIGWAEAVLNYGFLKSNEELSR